MLISVNRRVQKYLLACDRLLDSGYDQRSHRRRVVDSTRSHDMVKDPDEVYFADQYWRFIKRQLVRFDCDRNGNYLDLGCGQGRITTLLADWLKDNGTVTGVDISESALRQARVYNGVGRGRKISFKTGDILLELRNTADVSVGGILLLEVLLFYPEERIVLQELERVLKPGGLLFVSVRSQYFNILSVIQERLFEMAPVVLHERSGRVFGTDVWFNWHRAEEFSRLLENEFGFDVVDLTGIGCCSGIKGDPHASIVRPSQLIKNERDILMDIETGVGHILPDTGRYILVAAIKK